ncbi:7319_t:CDS:2 [Rhizophagus irregularis]|nr:7319_t:CDS:2 [Rhizophagus irregularis]
MTDIFMRHPILKSLLVALVPIGYRSIPNDRIITQLLDWDTDISFPHPIIKIRT